MKDKIDKFLDILPTMTKEESDYIADVLKWDDETRIAFIIAKRSFEYHEKEYEDFDCYNELLPKKGNPSTNKKK